MKRIQRKRKKGWKSPPNTKFCGRPSLYGNQFKVIEVGPRLYAIDNNINNTRGMVLYNDKATAIRTTVQLFAFFFEKKYKTQEEKNEFLTPLLGYDYLSCWCREDEHCHVDYLISMVNQITGRKDGNYTAS